MKKAAIVIFLVLVTGVMDLHAYMQHHYYLTSKVVESVRKSRIKVSGRLYAVKPHVPVKIPSTSRLAGLGFLKEGDRVTIRVEGSEVTEITVEGR